jgi:hypothetical protein
MKLKWFEGMNSARFLNSAFESRENPRLIKAALTRRNIYMALFITGFVCIFITALTEQSTLCILSLFLATLSLVVMTKYDTQVFFLRIIKLRKKWEIKDPGTRDSNP